MYVRTAINGQPMFLDYNQTFQLSDFPAHSVGSKLRSHLELTSLAVAGMGYLANEDDVEMEVSPDFVVDKADLVESPPVEHVSEIASFEGMVIDGDKPVAIMLSMRDPSVNNRLYVFLLELDGSRPADMTVRNFTFMDTSLRYKLNSTVVVAFNGNDEEFAKEISLGRVDDLPGWAYEPGVEHFTDLPFMERLTYFRS